MQRIPGPYRPYLSELIGTFVVVFLGAGAVCAGQQLVSAGHTQSFLFLSAVTEGLAYAVALTVTLTVSGGYLNPATTLMLWVFKRLDGGQATWLAAMQLVGSVLAGLALYLSFSQTVLINANVGAPHLNREAFDLAAGADPTLWVLIRATGVEAIFSFMLTFVLFATTIDRRVTQPVWLVGLGSGLVLTGIILMGRILTGAAVNPARWLGPVLWELALPAHQHALRDHVVYWLGPSLGALLAGGVYTVFILPSGTAARTPTVDGATEPVRH